MACLKASFHSGVMCARRLSTTCGVCRAASKFWNPASPARCIHWRSRSIPSLVIFPFIQCHHTRGRAPLGGFWKPLLSGSGEFCPKAAPADKSSRAVKVKSFLCALTIWSQLSSVEESSHHSVKARLERTRRSSARHSDENQPNYRRLDLAVSREINHFSNEISDSASMH